MFLLCSIHVLSSEWHNILFMSGFPVLHGIIKVSDNRIWSCLPGQFFEKGWNYSTATNPYSVFKI